MNLIKIMHEEVSELDRLGKRIDKLERYLDDDNVKSISVAGHVITDDDLIKKVQEVIDNEYIAAVEERREFMITAVDRMKQHLGMDAIEQEAEK